MNPAAPCLVCSRPTRARFGICQATPECRAEYARRYMAEYNYRDVAPVRCICGAEVRVTKTAKGKTARCKTPACVAARATEVRERARERKRARRHSCPVCDAGLTRSRFNRTGICLECDPRAAAVLGLLNSARIRADAKGVQFDMDLADLMPLPSACVYLGLELRYRQAGQKVGGPADNSASLDRIDPALGYVRGNVAIVSRRANAIKNDATPDELRMIASGVEALSRVCGCTGNANHAATANAPTRKSDASESVHTPFMGQTRCA